MTKKKERPLSVAKIVERYMYEHPILMSQASEGILNTSSLARKIKIEEKISKTDEAVMISLYRFLEKMQKVLPPSKKANEILKNTAVNIHSDYAVLVADIKQDVKAKNIISYSDKQVCIGEMNNLQKYRKNSLFYRENLALIELRHKENIEDVPGVLFHLLARFYEQSITIMEIFSAWDATYILIEKKDVQKIMRMFFE
ncbi:MAG: hypothetical protein WC492_00480 [Candidatus Micrarchaeia archaeon]